MLSSFIIFCHKFWYWRIICKCSFHIKIKLRITHWILIYVCFTSICSICVNHNTHRNKENYQSPQQGQTEHFAVKVCYILLYNCLHSMHAFPSLTFNQMRTFLHVNLNFHIWPWPIPDRVKSHFVQKLHPEHTRRQHTTDQQHYPDHSLLRIAKTLTWN